MRGGTAGRRGLAAGLVASLLGASCTPTPAELVVANGADVALLDPQLATGAPEGRVLQALFDGLVRLDPRTLEPRPALAERWESLDAGRRWRFTLRADLRWSDGAAFAPEEVVLSWMRLLDPATGAPYREWLEPLVGARAWQVARRARRAGLGPLAAGVGPAGSPAPLGLALSGLAVEGAALAPPIGLRLRDRTIEVRFGHAVPAFAEMCAYHALAPVPVELREADAATAARAAGRRGTGPFRLVERRVRDRVRVERNPHSWRAAAVALTDIDFLTVESQFTALNLFLAGRAHYLADVPSLAIPALLDREEERRTATNGGGAHAEFAPAPFLATYFYRFNVTRPPFDDARVRRALSLAVDREALAAGLGAGQPVARALVPPWIPDYEPPAGHADDPDRARALLAEAGFPDGEGLPVLELSFNSSEVHRDLAEALQARWRSELGVRTRLHNQEWKVFLDAQRSLDYELSRSSWIGDYQDAATFLEIFRSGSPNNRTGWSDARYDALLDAARSSTDADERRALLHEAEQRLLEEAPLLPLHHYVGLELVSERVQGFARNLRGYVDWGECTVRAPER